MAKTSRAYNFRVRYLDVTEYIPFRNPNHDVYESVIGLMVPKMLLTDDEIIREIHLEARMLQRVYDHFQSQIKAGIKGIPNSRCLKAKELDLARRLEPVYDLDKFPNDPYAFEQDWIKKQGALTIVRKEFTTYAMQMLAETPVKQLKGFVELTLGREALKKEIDHFWRYGNPNPLIYDEDSVKAYGELVKRHNENHGLWLRDNEPVEAIKPFVEYETFDPYAPHQCTEEELAEIERRHEETLGMGTPSERTAREYLFDLIDAEPWAREALEIQAEDNEEAAKHLKWLFEQKAAQATNKMDESVSDDTEATSINEATSEQEEMIRQMYALTVEGCDEPFFDIERSTTKSQPNCRPAVETHCTMGTLIDI
ncbi:uncharacterized protein B0J16DRAFT_401937 [Fusarium flagelliforme]|uniref:uncharacterized protein n=1 Tax=Fusarium flagelliforme TaxID=2675880 RepID=UPI001E8D2E50|nr:uncharacterized protein B0J16DRAFT_401937 [Fusarium flagelliforme]KAH7183516.1 hypothetical protein B0J16DRAFT_401937 [Fusarium flagelliforme]